MKFTTLAVNLAEMALIYLLNINFNTFDLQLNRIYETKLTS